MTPIAQMVEDSRKRMDVIRVRVFASPATIGMNAFTDGISLPTKI